MHNSLGTLKGVPQWFLWSLTWDAAAAKYQKRPCPLDGSARSIDASLSANWNSYEVACKALAQLPRTPENTYTLGFWLTAECGVFLVDMDHCTDSGGALTPFATQIISAFPGAMMEWSSSRKGVHVIGRATMPPHGTRDAHKLGMELYHCKRGIAFGLTGEASGSVDTRHDAAVSQLIAQYFPPRAEVAPAECRTEWRGPADDDELIRRMLAARVSAAATFGNKVSLQQLWGGKCERNSEHDMALAAHLAFWTGCDAERIERLMRRSGMERDKWNEHRTYLQMTIGNACAVCTNVYREPPPLPVAKAGTIRNAAELLRQQFNPVQWAIRDILPEGVTILSGDPKIGKSWFVYQACVAVATGSALWHGRDPEVQGDSLMLALEDNDRRLRRRLDKLLQAFPGKSPERLHYVTEWPRAEAGVTAIAEWLREHPQCRMLVIDTISAFRDSDPGRKSAYAHDYAVGEMLKPLAREFSCAIVLVMHNRKQAAGDVMHKVSGTQGMTGSVDNVLILERGRGESDAVLHVDGRDIEQQQELALRLNSGIWSCLGNAQDVQRSKERNSVLEAIATLGGCGTAKEIHEAIGGRVALNTVKVRLSRMHKAAEVEKNGSIYTLVNPADKFTPILPPLPNSIIK